MCRTKAVAWENQEKATFGPLIQNRIMNSKKKEVYVDALGVFDDVNKQNHILNHILIMCNTAVSSPPIVQMNEVNLP